MSEKFAEALKNFVNGYKEEVITPPPTPPAEGKEKTNKKVDGTEQIPTPPPKPKDEKEKPKDDLLSRIRNFF
jgi:hypothetical protein